MGWWLAQQMTLHNVQAANTLSYKRCCTVTQFAQTNCAMPICAFVVSFVALGAPGGAPAAALIRFSCLLRIRVRSVQLEKKCAQFLLGCLDKQRLSGNACWASNFSVAHVVKSMYVNAHQVYVCTAYQ